MQKPFNNGAAFIDTGVLSRTISDQTICIHFLNPLVDDGARPDVSHLAEDGSLVGECPRWRSIALIGIVSFHPYQQNEIVIPKSSYSIFRKEYWHRGISCRIEECVVARLLECAVAAPSVGIQGIKVESLIAIWPTGEVVLKHWKGIGISGGVSDGN